jgi:threonyl-tRNA synthetase
MSVVHIILPDGKSLEFDHEPSALEVAMKIGPRLAKDTLGVKINGLDEVLDLRLPLKDGTKISIVTTKSPEARDIIRHSAAHVMAQAVQSIWPDVKVTIGPVVDTGFYYDFDSPRNFTPDDFEKIEKKMEAIIASDLEIRRENIDSKKAIEIFQKLGETYKVELIEGIADAEVGIYHNGDQWFDLCRGPHVQRTSQIKSVKVMSLAGSYWRGDETRQRLQRIYATAFQDKKELEVYLNNIEEAKKRDHRKLGKDLGLFMFHPYAPGSPFFTGRGTTIYNELVKYIRELYVEFGYQEVITPQIFDVELFKTSGHYANYRENMYFTSIDKNASEENKKASEEERQSSMKPMNCPSHCLMFAAEKHSYRDLPLRIADFGRLHRFERSGVMHGLARVRTFCQDDGHVFCRPEQVQAEIISFMKLLMKVYEQLGMKEFKAVLATRPEKRMGTDSEWDLAERELAQGLTALEIPYKISAGDGAFYGPKIEIHFVDTIGRSWQLGTAQLDFNLPQAFDLSFTGEDNTSHRPVMLHRAILGSLERFIGIYLEHTAGHLPTWLAPVQAVLINVTDKQEEYCREIEKQLLKAGVRVEFDARNEKLGYKIREAQLRKIPFMLIIGDKEVESRTVSIRLASGQVVSGISRDEFTSRIQKEIQARDIQTSFKSESGINQEVSH